MYCATPAYTDNRTSRLPGPTFFFLGGGGGGGGAELVFWGGGGGGGSTDRYVDVWTACAAYRCTMSLNSCPTLTVLTSVFVLFFSFLFCLLLLFLLC